jgi:Histone acetyltransferase
MNIIFLSELADKTFIDYMRTRGTVILVPKDERFDERISSHPDLVISILDGSLMIDENAHSKLFHQLDELRIPYVTGTSNLSAAYPHDVAYNAVITKDVLLHHLDYTNPLLLSHCKDSNKKLIAVNQGYTKCSTVVVDNNILITSDPGIYHATKDLLKVLFVQPGHVSLEGFDFGFLGGTSGVIEDTVIFHGDLRKHPDYLRIVAFLEEAHKKVLFFEEFPLTDIGSILVFEQPKLRQPENVGYHKHVNIPIFISHEGCPNDCVFCNQRKITAKANAMTLQEVTEQIETYSSTLDGKTYVELAFFGGSFTGIDPELQENYLKIALEYKKAGKIHAIRLSTRPDYITSDILDRLKYYEVDTIELGVQSLSDEVLIASNRGHQVTDVYQSVRLIHSYGFHLGIQLMVGLPEDTKERSVLSAKLAALLKPEFVRIYPTLVIRETQLLELCNQGNYHPLSIEEAVDWTKDMYRVFLKRQIPVIRMGLQPTDLISEGKEVLFGPFHPAFRQLVESAYFLDEIKNRIEKHNTDINKNSDITILCNQKDLSQIIGHKRKNMIELNKEYPQLHVVVEERIPPMTFECIFS